MTTSNIHKFGWIRGVYVPSLLTIFGVIMYLRMGWVLANVGLLTCLIIITLSSAITFLTGLSITATATNMPIKQGGAYYIISRSFGIEAGAATGIALYFAQAISVAFYITGFTESLTSLVPGLPSLPINLLGVGIMTLIAYHSTNFALHLQSMILMLIGLSLLSIFLGQSPTPAPELSIAVTDTVGFWGVFAVFFPAVTGITAGLAMSGDLKDPATALPKGTLAAVITSYLVYMAIPIFLATLDLPATSLEHPLVLQTVALVPALVIVGLWGSTLSSALGSIMGAPRTLQALAKDKVTFSFLAKTEGSENVPRRATLVTYAIASVVILLGDLNTIASILTMFFLTTYGVLNLGAGLESLMGNPSWRPTFHVSWWLSLAGAFLCFAVMFMIDAGSTFIAIFCVLTIYLVTKKRRLGSRWSDVRRGLLMAIARHITYNLEGKTPDARSWRPNILAFTGSPKSRWHLIELADAMTHDKSFLTIGALFNQREVDVKRALELERSVRDYLRKKNIQGMVEVHSTEDIGMGMRSFVQSYGLGPLKPNTIMMGDNQDTNSTNDYVKTIRVAYESNKNILIVRQPTFDETTDPGETRTIDVWWGRKRQNGNLMLALAYLLNQSHIWRQTIITLKTTILRESERDKAKEMLDIFVAKSRLKIDTQVILVPDNTTVTDTIVNHSRTAKLVFLGIKPPEDGESEAEYVQYYTQLMGKFNDLPLTCFVMASENINFQEIFS